MQTPMLFGERKFREKDKEWQENDRKTIRKREREKKETENKWQSQKISIKFERWEGEGGREKENINKTSIICQSQTKTLWNMFMKNRGEREREGEWWICRDGK